jgi:triacylglycerol esterase/lipase EstA (alpha/beta hydrolase family)
MLARLQQFTALTLVGICCGWALLCIERRSPILAVAGVGAIAAAYATALAFEFWLLLRSYGAADSLRPSLSQLLSAWLREVIAAPPVFLWRQPFRSEAEPDNLDRASVGRRGIVFVHGFLCNRGLWNPWMRQIRADGIPFVAVTLEPVFGSIDLYAPGIDKAVHDIAKLTQLAPVIVAHSMGGLAVRAWLALQSDDGCFHRVVTIATPHRGTSMAQIGRTRNGREMRLGRPWLKSLAFLENAQLHERFICFWGHCDNIVFPTFNATLPGADNRHLVATPHVQMVYHPLVMEEVIRMVGAPTRPA